jgi:2-oxoglutarate ferredoxin oxidoreductase subunit gamma
MDNRNEKHETVIIAGFGGQGIILSGKLIAHTAMRAGKNVTYMPSYGAEVRGGTANCMVVISDDQIASPVVTYPNSLVAMNKASLKKFASRVKPGGLLVYNSSQIDTGVPEDVQEDITTIAVPADEIAVELGSRKSANMAALGAYLGAAGILSIEQVIESLPEVLARRYHKTLPVNTSALKKGAQFAASFAKA